LAWVRANTLTPSNKIFNFEGKKQMSQDTVRRFNGEMAKFKKALEEINMLKSVSEDLKSYRRMVKIKQFD
jgi:butyrate kinase